VGELFCHQAVDDALGLLSALAVKAEDEELLVVALGRRKEAERAGLLLDLPERRAAVASDPADAVARHVDGQHVRAHVDVVDEHCAATLLE